MSVRIGDVEPSATEAGMAVAHVSASRGGVEVFSDTRLNLQPAQARNYAALLVRGAEEVERMRARPDLEAVTVRLADAAEHCRFCRECGDGPCCSRCDVEAATVAVRELICEPRERLKAVYPPSCRRCNDRGVIETGNNDLPCECPAGDQQLFNTERGRETGAEIKARRR